LRPCPCDGAELFETGAEEKAASRRSGLKLGAGVAEAAEAGAGLGASERAHYDTVNGRSLDRMQINLKISGYRQFELVYRY